MTAVGRFFVGSTPYVVVDGLTRSVAGGVEVAPSAVARLLRTVTRQDLRRILVRVLDGRAGSELLDPLATAGRLLERQRLRLFRMPESVVPVEPLTTHEAVGGPGAKVATHWVDIELRDAEGEPVPGARYVVQQGDVKREGQLNEQGFKHVDHLLAGTCEITFPDLDRDTWCPADQGEATGR